MPGVRVAYSRMIVDWAMTEHMRTELVADAPRFGHAVLDFLRDLDAYRSARRS